MPRAPKRASAGGDAKRASAARIGGLRTTGDVSSVAHSDAHAPTRRCRHCNEAIAEHQIHESCRAAELAMQAERGRENETGPRGGELEPKRGAG